MASLDLSNTVQPPTLTRTPTPLDLLPKVQQGGLFCNGRLSWSLCNGAVYVSNTSTGDCLQNWSPSSPGEEVTMVSELRGPKGSLLVVAIEGYGCHMIGVLSPNWGKLIRGVSIPDKITSLHSFNFDGFSEKCIESYRCPHIFPSSVLSLFNGIVAIGTVGGRSYLVDLQLGLGASSGDCLNDPSPLHIIEGPVTERDITRMSESGHVTVEISKGRFQRGKFMYLQSLLSTSSVVVTAMYFAPQISALFVGYSFGGFQMYDLSSFQLLHTCAVSAPLSPVTHFTYVEPENDPRKFVYVWVMRGNSRFVEGSSCGATAYHYQMIFSEKVNGPGDHTHYRGFQGCGLRFEHILNDNPHSAMEHVGSRVLTCATPIRHRQEQPGHSLELDLSQAVLVWMVPPQTSNSDSEGTWSVFVGLFDVNQWYHSQMPRCIRWKAKGKYTGVFGCSYLSFYNVSSALPTNPDTTVMDALVECLMPFYSNPPMPETFMWPSAAKFNLKILTNSSLATCQCLGIQRMVLRQLDECRGSLFAQPEVLFQLCAHTELLPSSYDHTPSRDLSSQRAALLGVVINHGAPTRILTSFADSWAGAGGDDPVISQWVESTRAELEQTKKLIYTKCFSEDPSPTPLSGHRRRMAAIEVFLGRLLSRGFQREGQRTGALYQAVGQLRLTVAGHKKVMEVICFLNEEGLACDYPSAALKRRYDMLRGGAELGNKLAIDCLIEDYHGNGDDSAPLYPPLSLLNYMEFLMTFDPLIQHCLVLYLLADLGSLTTPPCSPQCRYAASNELPSDLNTIHSLWLVDNVKFKDPAYEREINVLFKRTSPHSLFPWQHGVILERLMQYGEVERALSYLQIHGQTMQELEELKLKIGVYVGNSLVKPAYHLLTQFEGSENYEELFKFFLECCIEGKCLHLILDLPLSSLAETTAVLYLEQHTLLICRELLVLYFAVHHRFVEALAMQESIRPFAKSDPDPNAMVRCAQRDALLAGLASVVPSSLHHVKLTHGDLRGQSSKVKAQVNKSFSSVVAKAIKCEGVTGGGGAVYSLIQTLAEKRLAPSDPMTPLRPSRMSVTMLSHTPFLSTPVSVKKLRASLSRPHPVLTPTPRSRPPTPHQSHTHQRFISHIQSFKDRMAALLNHSSTGDLDLSDLQTPSPMKAGQLLRPVITPTSILKGSHSASKLTDKRIRFAVEGSPPSPEKERQRQVYTPFVPSSLSTTTSIAITTPLPSSDDDCYESPVESPSQLHSPTPAHSPPHLSTKLDYRDAENSPAKETATVTMETNDSPPSEDDNDEMDNNIVEQDVSIVGQEASDEESEDEESEDRRYLELSEPVRHIPTPTKTSPYKDMDLTRGKLVSSVSPKHDPKTKAKKQSLPSQVPTFRSMRGGPSSSVSLKHEGSVGSTNTFSSPFVKHPQTPAASTSRLFAPVTTEMTPVTQLFSPVPYLSDLIQAKKDKLHSSFQQLKQQDIYSIKAPQKTISPMVNQSSFSASMVPNVDVPTGTSYKFSPPTQVPVDAHTTSVTTPERSESMSYVFSPPLTRSAARQRREGSSVSRESSVEPTLPVGNEAVGRKPRGRPRKVTLPPSDDPVTPPRKVTLTHSDDLVTLVTPPTLPRVLKEPPKKSRPRVKSGMASRRSARLLKK